MRINAPFTLSIVLCLALIISWQKRDSGNEGTPKTWKDTALYMLREFIIEGPDSNLGFTDFTELDSMENLRLGKGSKLYFYLRDSLSRDFGLLDSLGQDTDSNMRWTNEKLLWMGRVIFPVYYRDSLRSSIFFDHTPHGFAPTGFCDRTAYVSAVAMDTSPEAEHFYVYVPALHNYIPIRHDKKGLNVLPTQSLAISMKEDFPKSQSETDLSPIKADIFFKAVRNNIEKREKKRIR